LISGFALANVEPKQLDSYYILGARGPACFDEVGDECDVV